MLGAFIAAMAGVFLITQTAMAAVTWGTVHTVASTHTWNDGMALARSTTSTTSYLHAVYATDVVGGMNATDTGPFVGAYYTRGNSSGSTWGTPKRLNPSGTHAVSPAVITSGRVVYAAYVSLAHWSAYDPSEPRQITVRINSNHGAAGSWISRKLEPGTTRVDRPAMAAWNTRGLLLTYTDADTGDIMLVTCGDLTVEDSGCAAGSVGTTTRQASNPADGFEGLPVVAVSGTSAVIAWLNGDPGGITAVTGNPGTHTFAAPFAVTAAVADGLSAAAKGSRFALSWAENAGVKVRFWTSGTWKSVHTVASVTPTGTYKVAYTTAVTLASTSTVGVAWAACRKSDCSASSTTGVDLRWRESSDNAVTWKSAVTVASYTVSSARRYNDFPSVLMSSATKRFVMYNGASSGGGSYRVLIRVGSG